MDSSSGRNTFEMLLKLNNMSSWEEADPEDSEEDSSLSVAKVTEVVKKLLAGNSLDIVGLSWLTHLC